MHNIKKLIESEILTTNERILWKRKGLGITHYALIRANGNIETEDGVSHKSPSGAARHLNKGKPVDGWLVWRLERTGQSLSELRYIEK